MKSISIVTIIVCFYSTLAMASQNETDHLAATAELDLGHHLIDGDQKLAGELASTHSNLQIWSADGKKQIPLDAAKTQVAGMRDYVIRIISPGGEVTDHRISKDVSGEFLNNLMTTAPKVLPMGSWVQVRTIN